jgi:hypothetical protein
MNGEAIPGTVGAVDARRSLFVGALLLVVAGSVTVAWWLVRPETTAADDVSAAGSVDPDAPPMVLAQWDASRAAAWAAGDARALRRLYAPGSRAGRHDVRQLRAYADQGLRVENLRTQVLSVDVLRRTARTLEIEVTDRLIGGVAVGDDGRLPLPAGHAVTRDIRLVKADDGWLVDEVSSKRPTTVRR